jgi:hypothetical protein
MHVRFILRLVGCTLMVFILVDNFALIWKKSFKLSTINRSSRHSYPHSKSQSQGIFKFDPNPLTLPECLKRRVHAHAAAALINFCEGVERDTLLPYLDPIVERLLKLLNPMQDGSRPTKRYVQEQAVTTLAMVADASETTFAKVILYCFSAEIDSRREAFHHNDSITRRSCHFCLTC